MDCAEERAAVVSLLVAVDQRRTVCSPSCSLTCTTCEAGLQRTTSSRLLSLINFRQTQQADTGVRALNSRINAYFQPSVNKGRKALAAEAQRRTRHNTAIRNKALMRIITLSLVNKAKTRAPPPPPSSAHSLGKRDTKEMRSAKFLITEAEQE